MFSSIEMETLIGSVYFHGLNNSVCASWADRKGQKQIQVVRLKFCTNILCPFLPLAHLPKVLVRDRSAHFSSWAVPSASFFILWRCDTFLGAQMQCGGWKKRKKTYITARWLEEAKEAFSYSWNKRVTIANAAVLLQSIYRFSVITEFKLHC